MPTPRREQGDSMASFLELLEYRQGRRQHRTVRYCLRSGGSRTLLGSDEKNQAVRRAIAAMTNVKCCTMRALTEGGPVPYDVVLGLDLLTEHNFARYFQTDKLKTYANGRWCELPVGRTAAEHLKGGRAPIVRPKTPAEQAYELLANQVAGISPEDAATFLRPRPKRYKSLTKAGRKVKIAFLVQQAVNNSKTLMEPVQGLYLILALPEVGEAEARYATGDTGGIPCAPTSIP
ncbi:hypothetical protein EBH_0024360 [Eimeria brunetti]|uniref:Uncharacterized protein n=1 Tax=Eimeria brunetti TaxID=51314 RepID=U6LIR8_9EIME|nr:hypothetical protein EBH_0024360 [Eimeria brunetti]